MTLFGLDLSQALSAACGEREAWCRSEIERTAPEIAKAPERVQRFLSNVQRMLAASDHLEALTHAREVAEDAAPVAEPRRGGADHVLAVLRPDLVVPPV